MTTFLTKKELAHELRVSTRTIDRYRAAGFDIGEIKSPTGTVRFRLERALKLFKSCKH